MKGPTKNGAFFCFMGVLRWMHFSFAKSKDWVRLPHGPQGWVAQGQSNWLLTNRLRFQNSPCPPYMWVAQLGGATVSKTEGCRFDSYLTCILVFDTALPLGPFEVNRIQRRYDRCGETHSTSEWLNRYSSSLVNYHLSVQLRPWTHDKQAKI